MQSRQQMVFASVKVQSRYPGLAQFETIPLSYYVSPTQLDKEIDKEGGGVVGL